MYTRNVTRNSRGYAESLKTAENALKTLDKIEKCSEDSITMRIPVKPITDSGLIDQSFQFNSIGDFNSKRSVMNDSSSDHKSLQSTNQSTFLTNLSFAQREL